MKFTKPAVAKLALPEGKSELIVFDDALPGFGLRLRAGGKRVWIAQYRVGAKQRRATIGSASVIDLDDARQRAREMLAYVQLGTDPYAEREAAKARAAVTFGSELPRYLARAEGHLRASSLRDVRRYLDVQSQPLHNLPLTEIRRAHVAALLGKIAETSGPFASNRARAALSTFFAWMVGEGLTETNVVIGTNKATAETTRDRVLTDAELGAVWRAADNRTFGPIVRLLILTGQRREEVAAMRWSELDLQGAVWRLPTERTKNKRPHDVPLSATALEILAGVSAREGRDLLFGEGKGGFSGFSKALEAFEARSGVTGWRIHDLRRTAATGMAGIGVLPHVVEAVLNHVSGARAGVAGVYNRASYATEKRAALDAWATHVLKLAEA